MTGDHDLAFSESGRLPLAHWTTGAFNYSIDAEGDNAVPSGWHSNMKKAATHLKDSTFLERVGYEVLPQANRISVEGWPFVVSNAWWGECGSPGTPSTYNVEACTYATNLLGIPDVGIYLGTNDWLKGSRIMFDPADVYVAGSTSVIDPSWIVMADGATRLERATAHELAHAAGFYAHTTGSNDLMHANSPVWNLSVDDRWEINRLNMQTNNGKLYCAKTMELSGSDFRNAGGVMHPSGSEGRLDNIHPICPATHDYGFAYYLYLNHDSDGRDFWTWATVNSTSPIDAVKRYTQEGHNPYKRGTEFTGTRRVERDEIFQLATTFRNSIPRNYQFRVVPDCTYPSDFLFQPGVDLIQEQGYDGKLSTTKSDSRANPHSGGDCRSAVQDDRYADFYNFRLTAEAYVTINATSNPNAIEGIQIDPLLRLREEGNTQFGAVLAVNDDIDFPGNKNAQIKEKLGSGWYTVEVSSFGVNDTGDYSFSVLADPYQFASALPSTMANGTTWSTTLVTAATTDRFTFRISDSNVVTFGSSSCPSGTGREETKVVVMPIESTLGNSATLSSRACSSGSVTLNVYSGQALLQSHSILVPTTGVSAPAATGSISDRSLSVGGSEAVEVSRHFTGIGITYSAPVQSAVRGNGISSTGVQPGPGNRRGGRYCHYHGHGYQLGRHGAASV